MLTEEEIQSMQSSTFSEKKAKPEMTLSTRSQNLFQISNHHTLSEQNEMFTTDWNGFEMTAAAAIEMLV